MHLKFPQLQLKQVLVHLTRHAHCFPVETFKNKSLKVSFNLTQQRKKNKELITYKPGIFKMA